MTEQMNIDRKRVALVTGATSGIGRAIARKLAKDGFLLLVHGRDDARGAETVELIEADGGFARFLQADLTNPEDVTRLAEHAGDADVLVNNAGKSWSGPSADLDVDTFDRLFAGNVRASYQLVAALAPKMAARHRQHHQRRQHGRNRGRGGLSSVRRDQGGTDRDEPRLGR
jgi:NAD(P)-dependent dehydrogenase (short-subunit alcohol dehydrogenase family)